MQFDEIISVGGNCDAAHHVRRYFKIEKSMPMDWLIVPFNALISMCNDNFRDFIRLDRLTLWNGTRHAIQCARRGIVYQHDFPRDAEALVMIDDIAGMFADVKAKYARRIERLQEACRPGRSVLFVRSWREILHTAQDYPDYCIRGVPDYQFAELLDALRHCFPQTSFKVLFVNYGAQSIDDRQALFADVRNCGDITDWTGSKGGWDEIFARFDIRLSETASVTKLSVAR